MKAAVLGLGESLREFTSNGYDFTIGVNDIFRHHKTDYLVVVDRQERFEKERLHLISMSTPETLFSQHDAWRNSLAQSFCKLKFDTRRGDLSNLWPPFAKVFLKHLGIPMEFSCPHSISSPFVAACIAYKLGATEIKLYGCDYLRHPILFEQRKIDRVKKDFGELKKELNKRGVQITCSSGSALTEILK